MSNQIQKILEWYEQFDNTDILIKTENQEYTVNLNKRQLPHLLGLHYTLKTKQLNGIRLFNYLRNKTDEEIFEELKKNNEDKMEVVENRVQYFQYFMEHMESAELVEQTHPTTKLKSEFLLVKDKNEKILQLGIAKDREYIDYFETFLVRQDNHYFKNSEIKEKVIELQKWEQDKLVPFSFRKNKLKEAATLVLVGKSDEKQYKIVSATEENYQMLLKQVNEFENYKIALFDKNGEFHFFVNTKNKEFHPTNLEKDLLQYQFSFEQKQFFKQEWEWIIEKEFSKNREKEEIRKKEYSKKYDKNWIEKLKTEVRIEQYIENEFGFHIKPVGRNVLGIKEHDSVRIYQNTNSYYRFSTKKGGDIIEFVKEFKQCDTTEALKMVTNYYEQNKNKMTALKLEDSKEDVEKNLVVPPKHKNNHHIIAYLQNRNIEDKIIEDYLKEDLIYQDTKQNLCFVSKNQLEEIKAIDVSGTRQYKKFKGKVSGSISFGILKQNNRNNKILFIAESVIDAMSFETLYKNKVHKYDFLSTMGVNQIIQVYNNRKEELNQYDKIIISFDNDDAGKKAVDETQEYFKTNYPEKEIVEFLSNEKDWNEELKLKVEKEKRDINFNKACIENDTFFY